jgi:hypothetical protein
VTNLDRKDTFVQTIPLAGITKLSQPNFVDYDEMIVDQGLGLGFKSKKLDIDDDIDHDNRIFMCSKNNIYALTMKQFYLQAYELQQKKDFDMALHLCDIVFGTKYEVEKFRVSNINLEYGFHQFSKGEYEKAMNCFTKTGEDPRVILALYPDLLSGASARTFKTQIKISEEDRIKVDQLMKDVDQKNRALSAVIQYLSCRRVAVSKALSKQEAQVAEAVDTALLKALLYTNDEFVTKFLENPNRCIISDCELSLLQYRKFSELVTFYRMRGLHEQALSLLKRMGQGSIGTGETDAVVDLTGVRPTIKYLQALESSNSLMLNYARWVLQKEPILGLKIFQSSNCTLSPDEILRYLDTVNGQKNVMSITYLEHVILVEKSTDPELHNSLILFYLEYIMNEDSREMNTETGLPLLLPEDVQIRLPNFLRESQYYNSERMLSKFPMNRLYEERAILLSRIHRHEQALNLYVSKVNRIDLAEKYCTAHFDKSEAAHEEARNIYISLLRMLIQPEDKSDPRLTEAVRIMEQHYEDIDMIKALQLFPADTPIQLFDYYFHKMLRTHVAKRRHLQVMKNLCRSENLQVQDKFIVEQMRAVKINNGRTCPVCNKKIRESAFACYPNDVVVHYYCMKNNTSVCPVTHRNFLKEAALTTSFLMMDDED